MFNINNRPGQFFQQHKRRVVNRTDGVVTVGGVYAIDIRATPAAETALFEGVGGITGLDLQDAYFHNIDLVDVTTLNGLIVVITGLLSGAGADNTEVEVTLCGQRIQVEVDGTADVLIGDYLVPVAAANHLVTQGGGAADEHAVGIALQGHTDATQVLIDAVFTGGMPMSGGGINA